MSVLHLIFPVLVVFVILALFFAHFFRHKCWPQPEDAAADHVYGVGGVQEHVTVVVARLEHLQEEGGDGGRECPVCLLAFEDGEGLWRINQCNHVFHAPCIERWIQMRSTCPVCRAHILEAEPSAVVRVEGPPMSCNRQGHAASSGLL